MTEIILKNYLTSFLSAFLISVILTYLIRLLVLKLKILDQPGEPRKIHPVPVPALGGLAIFLTYFLVMLIFSRYGFLTDGRITFQHLTGIIIGGALLMIGGYFDDKYSLKPQQTFIWPVLAALVMVFSGLSLHYITNPFGGLLFFGSSWLGSILVFLWLLGIMYTTKFLDGLDGLVSGITGIGALILFVVSLFWDKPLSGTSILCLILAGAAFGFLVWNFNPAKIFLGESGSLFLGFMLGVLSLISGAKIATALLILGIPILDVAWVIARRVFKEKKSAFVGDNKHLHFRLLDAGLNQRQAVLLLYLLTLLFGTASLFQQTIGKLITLGILLIVMICLALWLIVRYQNQQNKLSD